MSLSTIRTMLFSLGVTFLCASCATTGRLVDQAGRSAESEAAERVNRGVSAGADATEEAVMGGDNDESASSGSNGSGSTGSGSNGSTSSSGGAAATGASAPNVAANYDYTRGERPLFYDDYADDNLGDFPRNLELVEGTWDVVDIDGRRWLRATGGRGSDFQVVLPEQLPERFTIEYEIMYTHGNQVTVLATSPIEGGPTGYEGTLVQVQSRETGAWIPSANREFFASLGGETLSDPTRIEIMVDGNHMKVFANGTRTANVPNAQVVRSDRLHFEDLYFSNPENPIYVSAIRVDAGGRDLYGELEREGRVALQGIYFDTGSDRLRPESYAALDEVGIMLSEHGDLTLLIEGHTDSQGDEASNLDLSDRRAASVRRYLVGEFGIVATRLSSRGLGESEPVASNDTPEGRQQNRRVELVRN